MAPNSNFGHPRKLIHVGLMRELTHVEHSTWLNSRHVMLPKMTNTTQKPTKSKEVEW